ncbi:MAG: C39 family peptidase [Cyanobacteria bacterium P01_F01_bin.53]
MKVQDFTQQDLRYDTARIAQDTELSEDLKARLVELGLLEEESEGSSEAFGTLAIAAFRRFQDDNDCHEPDFLGPETSAKLIEAADVGGRSAAKPLVIKTLKETELKARPIGAEMARVSLPAGKELDVVFFEKVRRHLRVTLTAPVKDELVWYIPEEDVSVIAADPSGGDIVHPPELPTKVQLKVPYLSQMDNVNNPTGSCNVTCVTMCLKFLKPAIQASNGGQLEDELYQYALNNGLSRHSPHDLAKIARDYGIQDRFSELASINEVKAWLDKGNPTITHGYFTSFGHIIMLVGYDEKGFIVHDPYGEWCAGGYDRNVPGGNNEKGKFQHYSYDLIKRTCVDDGDGSFWIHFVSA